MSETGNKGKHFDQQMLNQKLKDLFIEDIEEIALDATQIPLSIFTNFFHQRFEKHSMLESTLEILHQFCIEHDYFPHECPFCPGDESTYTLQCMRCGKNVTLAGSIGKTLFHAPTAML
jgi:hypothetical protein